MHTSTNLSVLKTEKNFYINTFPDLSIPELLSAFGTDTKWVQSKMVRGIKSDLILDVFESSVNSYELHS